MKQTSPFTVGDIVSVRLPGGKRREEGEVKAVLTNGTVKVAYKTHTRRGQPVKGMGIFNALDVEMVKAVNVHINTVTDSEG